MKLLTEELCRILPALYSQENTADPTVHCKFFTPWSNWTWFVTEGEPEEQDFRFFGYVCGQDLASCGKDRSELQRSLPRARCTAADDGPALRDCHARVSFRTCRGSGADLKTAVHKIPCTIRNCKQEDNIAARSY